MPTLPPSDRDFAAFRLVRVEQQTTRFAAETLGISQPRVCQIVQKVADFLVETVPVRSGEDEAAERGRRLQVARFLAADRVDFLFGQAVRSYKKSRGTHVTVREVQAENRPTTTITTTRQNFGETRYLAAAARLALLGSKLPVAAWPLGVGEGVDDGSIVATRPPVEACSSEASEQPQSTAQAPAPLAISPVEEAFCENSSAAKPSAKNVTTTPVQPGVPTPSQRRRERRARQAFLAAS